MRIVRKFFGLIFVFVLTLELVGCSFLGIHISGDSVNGRMNKWLHPGFFNFRITGVTMIKEYGEYTAGDNNMLVDIIIEIYPTMNMTFPIQDFKLNVPSYSENYIQRLDSRLFKENNVMPLNYLTTKDIINTSHVIYEVPIDSKEMSFTYSEYVSGDPPEIVIYYISLPYKLDFKN